MRIATYNIEWFNSLFDDNGALLLDGEWSSRYNITRQQQAEALGLVFNAMDADAVMIVEAPDYGKTGRTEAALSAFAAHFGLRTSKVLTGFANETQQEIALLYDPTKLNVAHDPIGEMTGKHGSADAPRFDAVFRIDLDIDATMDQVRFSKPPLEVAVTTANGQKLRLIGVHVKSKAPHGATSEADVMRIAIANRRKQLAQCIWLRQRVEGHLAAGEDLIVMGDFNDGPGLDEYEKLFGRSGIEIVLGDDGAPQMYDPNAQMALCQRIGTMPTTSRFYLRHEERYLQALLDYIMVSPGLRAKSRRWRIWHPFDEPLCYQRPALRDALLAASDHFPVTLDLDL